jgi:hypothetical protein
MHDNPGEERAFIRVPMRTSVAVRTVDRTIKSSTGINISMRGLHLSTTDALPAVGTPCTARIILNEDSNPLIIEAAGTVVRTGQQSLAVEFKDLDFDGYLNLRRLILNNSDDPDRAEREFSSHWGIKRPLV